MRWNVMDNSVSRTRQDIERSTKVNYNAIEYIYNDTKYTPILALPLGSRRSSLQLTLRNCGHRNFEENVLHGNTIDVSSFLADRHD